jgi:hypothetical protein
MRSAIFRTACSSACLAHHLTRAAVGAGGRLVQLPAVAALMILGVSQASADVIETFQYTGNLFTTANPTQTGITTNDSVTATVTLDCSTVCSAGTYVFGTGVGDITALTLSVGPDAPRTYTASANLLYAGSFFDLSGPGQVSSWLLKLNASGNCCDDIVTDYRPGTNNIPIDAFEGTFEGSNTTGGFNQNNQGIWMEQSVSVPGPIAGTGLPGLPVLAGLGLFWWRRKRPAHILGST